MGVHSDEHAVVLRSNPIGSPWQSKIDRRLHGPCPSSLSRALNCNSERSDFFLSGVDDLTGRPGRFTFVRCSDCGLVYQTPRLTPSHIRSYYDNEYIAHQPHARWGVLAPLFRAAMESLDRAKLRIVTTLRVARRGVCRSGRWLRGWVLHRRRAKNHRSGGGGGRSRGSLRSSRASPRRVPSWSRSSTSPSGTTASTL